MDGPLFGKFELRLTIEAHQRAAVDEVKAAPEGHVLQVDIDAWADALAEKWNLDCPKLDVGGLYQDPP